MKYTFETYDPIQAELMLAAQDLVSAISSYHAGRQIMTPEVEQVLFDKYRQLFYHDGMDDAYACRHIECGDGWYDIVDRALADMSEYDAVVTQVKEKFGLLRIYFVLASGTVGEIQDLDDIVDRAEWESRYVCEACGEPGELRNGGWFVTLCDECNDNKEEWR